VADRCFAGFSPSENKNPGHNEHYSPRRLGELQRFDGFLVEATGCSQLQLELHLVEGGGIQPDTLD
jgi:hypothetical protein